MYRINKIWTAGARILHCGAIWQPTFVKRVIAVFQTSTRVAWVETNIGNGYLKCMGNPAGVDSLISELVAAELANWFGLKQAPFALVQTPEIEIIGVGGMIDGPAFITQEMTGLVADGHDVFIDRLSDKCDISRLVTFDTWIRNTDRHHPDQDHNPCNRDNLFFRKNGKKFDLVALDHSHCFVQGTFDSDLGQDGVINDDRVYGLFPEFKPFIDEHSIIAAATKLRELNLSITNEIVASIPRSWELTTSKRQSLSYMINERAKFVADLLTNKLLQQQGLSV